MVLVVDEAHLDAARMRGADRVGDPIADRSRQAYVVERQLERAARAIDEVDDPGGDVVGALTAVSQLVEREAQNN
jgi:hypothetical protein